MNPQTLLRYLSILLFCLPLSAHAYRDPYYARSESSRTASELDRFVSAAAFTYHRLYAGRTGSLEYFCSLQKLIPQNRGGAFRTIATEKVASFLYVDPETVSIALVRAQCDTVPDLLSRLPTPRKPLRLDAVGRVISANPVWNACIRQDPLTPAQLRANHDVFLHRQRSITVRIPFTCRDYHRGEISLWRFPDDPAVELSLDPRGRLLGDPPPGYFLAQD